MNILTLPEIDRELTSWAKQVADLSTTLIDFDNHPGLEHVRRYPPTGATAARWAVVETTLGQLWDDLASATSTLQSAQAVRGRRSKLDDDTLAELTRLLESHDPRDRMHATCDGVTEFLDAVDTINAKVAAGIAPLLKRLDAAGAGTPKAIDDLLTVSATDPLSLTVSDVDQRITVIADLVALQENWTDIVASTFVRLDELQDATKQAQQTHIDAERVVLSALPAAADTEPELRAELESITVPDPVALRSLLQRIESALQLIRHHEELTQGLLDRRAELKGRLKAYEAKAARLGLAEDPDVLSSQRIASGLISRRPCDLRAVTRAVNDYQQLVSDKRGAMR
jgi:hypothetical protein